MYFLIFLENTEIEYMYTCMKLTSKQSHAAPVYLFHILVIIIRDNQQAQSFLFCDVTQNGCQYRSSELQQGNLQSPRWPSQACMTRILLRRPGNELSFMVQIISVLHCILEHNLFLHPFLCRCVAGGRMIA